MSSVDAPALVCRDVRKAFGGRVVLDGVDLDVTEGGITAVLGPSGGGKTTLLRLVAGFDHADAGTIAVHGRVVDGEGRPVPAERRRVGCVPQEGALFPHLSVGANVAFGLRRGPERAARVAECLDLVGLAGSERARPHELSGGQQQRVALARALAPHPDLILLDEPFSSLDAGLRAQVRAEVCDAVRRAGATAVLVTHDQEEALSVADAVAVLLDGRMLQTADPVALYRAPVSLEVARFVGEAVLLPGRRSAPADPVDCALGRLEVGAGDGATGSVVVLVRPEQLRLGSAGSGVPALVVGHRFLGSDAVVDLDLTGTLAQARVDAFDLPPPGAAVVVSVAGPVAVYRG